MLCTAMASGWTWPGGAAKPMCSLSPCQEPAADGWKCTRALQRAQTPHSPAPTIPHCHPPPVGHEQGEASSQQHCLAPGMATAPQPQTSLQEWAAPTQCCMWSSLPSVSRVMCSSLQAHVIRLHFPLFLFSLKKPSCTMSIFSTSWSWIRCLTCGLPSSKGKISTFFSPMVKLQEQNLKIKKILLISYFLYLQAG